MILYYCDEKELNIGRESLLHRCLVDYCAAMGSPLLRSESDPVDSVEESQRRILKENCRLTIEKGLHGKPYVPGLPELHFSISHSGGFWCCGVAEAELGIDIEEFAKNERRRTGISRYFAIAERFFTEEENQYVKTFGVPAFFSIWTSKEAFLKYRGVGLSGGLENVSVVRDGRLISPPGACIKPFTLPGKSAAAAVGACCSGQGLKLDRMLNLKDIIGGFERDAKDEK